jgi:hypothetical protein
MAAAASRSVEAKARRLDTPLKSTAQAAAAGEDAAATGAVALGVLLPRAACVKRPMGVVAGWARGLAAAAADARGAIAASAAGFDAGLKEVALGVGGTRALAAPLGLAEGVAGALPCEGVSVCSGANGIRIERVASTPERRVCTSIALRGALAEAGGTVSW